MNWRKSVLLKKGVRYSFDLLRLPYRAFVREKDYISKPPVIANSFPKSGTHLLIQILQAISGIRDWGLFLASTPSFTFREISDKRMAKKITKILPQELVSAHMHYSEKADKALNSRNVAHYFIFRDPRDVVISEAHYLTYMNRWHRLHPYFKDLPDMDARIMFSIQGAMEPDFPYDYKDIGSRFCKYEPWISKEDVLSIKYEDLAQKKTEETARKILQFYVSRSTEDVDLDLMIQKALNNINPKNSHTFRSGKTAAWKEIFTQDHKEAFKNYAGRLLVDLGYEQDENW